MTVIKRTVEDFRKLWKFDVFACTMLVALLNLGGDSLYYRLALGVGILVVAEFRGRAWSELHPDLKWWQS